MTQCLDELTYKQMRAAGDSKSKQRSKKLIQSVYKGIDKKGVAIFNTPSQYYYKNHLIYTQKIKFLELEDVAEMEDLTVFQKVTLLIGGELAVWCECPAFKYWGYEYILTQVDSVFGTGEERYPEIRNPELRGSVCKHLLLALQVMPGNISSMARDFKKRGLLTGKLK